MVTLVGISEAKGLKVGSWDSADNLHPGVQFGTPVAKDDGYLQSRLLLETGVNENREASNHRKIISIINNSVITPAILSILWQYGVFNTAPNFVIVR